MTFTGPTLSAICPWTLAPGRRIARMALRDRASAEQVEEAEIDAASAEHEAWKAAGPEVARGVHG
jgi:hypothetical protein